MIYSHFSKRDNDQQYQTGFRGLAYFQTHPNVGPDWWRNFSNFSPLPIVRSFVPKVPFQNMDSTGTFAAPSPSLLRRPTARRSSWPETFESPRRGICSWKLTFLVPWCTAMPAGCHRWQVRVLGLQWGYGQPSSLAAAQDCRS